MRPKPRSHQNSSRSNSSAPARVSPKDEWRAPKEGRIVIGHHALRELLKVNSKSIKKMGLVQGFERNQDLREIADFAQGKKIKFEVVSEKILDALGSHQGAAAIVSTQPLINWENIFKKEASTIVVLDGVEDPHNLGAILRSSWLLGVDAILLSEDRGVSLTPVAHKVACGGVEYVPVEFHHQFQNIFSTLKDKGYWIFGMDHESKQSLVDFKIPEKVCWVFGAEGKGLRSTTLKACDQGIRLPQAQADASYNVSNAAAMTLFETHRQNCNRAT